MNEKFKKEFKKDSKAYKFLQLSNLDENGFSREVKITEFVGNYSDLKFGNGADWARKGSKIARMFNLEFIKSNAIGQPTIALKLNGINSSYKATHTQSIRSDIKKEISQKRCIILGTNRSSDFLIEVDHKDGRKDDPRVMNTKTQTIDDFQPLSKPANNAKRQFCKECKETGKRYDAKKHMGYPVSFIKGDENYTEELKCIGCFWYDPIAFRQSLKIKNS